MKTKENNSFEVEYTYDIISDILGVKVKRDYIYQETIEMNEEILLDFDKKNRPVSLELHDASKRLNILKHDLKEIAFLNIDVKVNEKFIKITVNITCLIQEKEKKHCIKEYTSNNYHIPNIETELNTA